MLFETVKTYISKKKTCRLVRGVSIRINHLHQSLTSWGNYRVDMAGSRKSDEKFPFLIRNGLFLGVAKEMISNESKNVR